MMWILKTLSIGNESSNIPASLHMMQHVFRGRNHFPIVKSIINTDTALMLDQHKVMYCLEGIDCNKLFVVNTKIGQLHHYRRSCPLGRNYGDENCEKLKHPENIVKDTEVWTHLETVIKNTNIALKSIHLNE